MEPAKIHFKKEIRFIISVCLLHAFVAAAYHFEKAGSSVGKESRKSLLSH